MTLSYPDLTREKYLVVDVETHDPYLKKLGTNAIHRARGGQLLGFSVYAPGGFNEYYEFEHGCPAAIWLADQLRLNTSIVGANLKYDLLWLLSESIWTADLAKRRYGDVLVNASLLDENNTRSHNLNGQAVLYGLLPKLNQELLAAASTIGLRTLDQVKCNMHLMQLHFPEIVAAYGKHDSYITGKVWEAQQPLLHAEGLTEPREDRPEAMPVVELEERFLPILVLMEAQGIRVDLDHAKALQDKLLIGIEEQKSIIKEISGDAINFNPSGSLRLFVERNCDGASRGGKKGDIQTGDKALDGFKDNPVIAAVLKARKLAKMEGTFVKGYILDKHVNGRIYPNIYQLASESEDGHEGGTTTGRQSYAKPNVQNIPIRNKEWGPLLRQMFIAEQGFQLGSFDFSQQEPRWAITWAVRWGIPGAAEAAAHFIQNPDADWHGEVAQFLGGPEWRDAGKVLVLARMYVQGQERCYAGMKAAGVPEANIAGAIENFDAKMGFLKMASQAADNYASKHGFVRTWSGRKRRFDLWEPKFSWGTRQVRKDANIPACKPLPRDEAMQVYFHDKGWPIVRSKTYPAFNAIVQGSSADQTKQCAIQAFYEDDLLAAFQVHDENVDAQIDGLERIQQWEYHMLDTIKLAVPSKVGSKIGKYWMK